MRNPWQGAEGIAWLMATKQSNLESGAFYLDRSPQRKHISGPFFASGRFTKNTDEEIEEMMRKMSEATGV